MKGLPATHPGTLIIGNNNIFFLGTCLLTSHKEQMPDISGMTVYGIPFLPYLLLSVDPPTPSSPLPHITLYPQEVA